MNEKTPAKKDVPKKGEKIVAIKKRQAKARLTHIQSHRLIVWLQSQAIEGRINERPGSITERAVDALGFPISRISVTTLCEELGIAYHANNEPPPETDTSEEYRMILNQVSRVERKLNLLMAELGVHFTE